MELNLNDQVQALFGHPSQRLSAFASQAPHPPPTSYQRNLPGSALRDEPASQANNQALNGPW